MEKASLNTNSYREKFVICSSYLIIFLFLYASINKISDIGKFQYELGKSPLVPFGYNKLISYITILLEISICILLSYKRFRKTGLLLSFSLLLFFTVYIFYLLNYSYFIPCSCGGILNDLSWEWHIVFNASFTGLALLSYIMIDYEK
ncbi:hypothetical protein CMT92_00150 [Elizabethkingia anophelis]|nr:hypothetical protein [Elizabethkingia anophelis]